jgi:Raf kinase inhibitor-like YbhB/YbcL family protein
MERGARLTVTPSRELSVIGSLSTPHARRPGMPDAAGGTVGRAIVLVLALVACAAPTTSSDEATTPMTDTLTVTSTTFAEGEPIPARHTCDGEDLSPPIAWSGAPDGTVAYALIVDDPDARGWIHWVVADIPAELTSLDEGQAGGVEGSNDFGRSGWGGPCPPSGSHRYAFEVLALSENVGLDAGFEAGELRAAMAGKVLASGRLTGTYRRGG